MSGCVYEFHMVQVCASVRQCVYLYLLIVIITPYPHNTFFSDMDFIIELQSTCHNLLLIMG